MKVLVADDEPVSRLLLENALTGWGYQVSVAENGDEALKQILEAEEAPRLVLLDWVMPKTDGLDVCRKVRQSQVSSLVYILLLTSKGKTHEIGAGLQAGANDYVTKPFDREELRARVKVGAERVELQGRVRELEQALANVKTLVGAIPVCGHCKRIRVDKGYWEQIEAYISRNSGTLFSPDICPACEGK